MTSSPSYFARGPHYPPTYPNPPAGYGPAQASAGVGQLAAHHDDPGLVAPNHRFIPPAHAYPSYHQQPPPAHPHGFDTAEPPMADAEFARAQKVQVRIRADVWVVGMVVSVLQFCKWISGRGYELEVEYVAPDTGRPTTGRFPPSDVRRA
ncbi:hypothetical protein DENSPDRAFT_832586 [Dentipellis sp. KUC8613]|nr:hypothetical protein DENSPDRAFT_832586 [Dentipellis sp. KUC8613]